MDLGIGSLDLCNWRLGVVFGFGFLYFVWLLRKYWIETVKILNLVEIVFGL